MSVQVFTGDDPSLLGASLLEHVERLVGGGDRTLLVDDFADTDYEIRAVVDAAQTPPFLTDRRIVVGRGMDRFNAEELATLVAYLADPLPTTELVITWTGRLPKALADALKRAGATVTATAPPSRKADRTAWIDEHLASAHLRLEPGAVALLSAWLGEDLARLAGIVHTLVATYGTERRLGAAQVEPFLGDAGGVPPWDLTDAIDGGDVGRAVDLLRRMIGAGERHPLQVMAILQNHYLRMLKLDGSGAHSEATAAEVLGIKGFPARKALDQYRRLGPGGTRRAVELLARADLDMRGATSLDADVVLDILVARLARLTPARGARR